MKPTVQSYDRLAQRLLRVPGEAPEPPEPGPPARGHGDAADLRRAAPPRARTRRRGRPVPRLDQAPAEVDHVGLGPAPGRVDPLEVQGQPHVQLLQTSGERGIRTLFRIMRQVSRGLEHDHPRLPARPAAAPVAAGSASRTGGGRDRRSRRPRRSRRGAAQVLPAPAGGQAGGARQPVQVDQGEPARRSAVRGGARSRSRKKWQR